MTKDMTIAVIGLGLIGASILKGLRNYDYKLVGVTRSQATVEKALSCDIVDECSTEITTIKDANIVFICTPINNIVQKIDEVSKIVNHDCLISDVASIKGFIVDHVNNSAFPINFIGGHPMAGTENKGIDFAQTDLFTGAKWVLTPSKWTNEQSIKKLEELIFNLGAKAVIADPYEHDKAVGLISHLPLILSQAIFDFVYNYNDKNVRNLALQLASSGFRDTTRLASTNPELAKDMLLENKDNVRKALNDLKLYLTQFDKNLDLEQDQFKALIDTLATSRKNMYSPEGKNIL